MLTACLIELSYYPEPGPLGPIAFQLRLGACCRTRSPALKPSALPDRFRCALHQSVSARARERSAACRRRHEFCTRLVSVRGPFEPCRHSGGSYGTNTPRSRGLAGTRRPRRLLSLRDTARAMSQENVEHVKAWFEAFNDDVDSLRDTLHPDIEWFPFEDNHSPSFGIDGAMRIRQHWLDSWQDARGQPSRHRWRGDNSSLLPT